MGGSPQILDRHADFVALAALDAKLVIGDTGRDGRPPYATELMIRIEHKTSPGKRAAKRNRRIAKQVSPANTRSRAIGADGRQALSPDWEPQATVVTGLKVIANNLMHWVRR